MKSEREAYDRAIKLLSSIHVEIAAEYGISRIIQPGGSIRDKEVIEACQKAGIGMVFTGKRVFLH